MADDKSGTKNSKEQRVSGDKGKVKYHVDTKHVLLVSFSVFLLIVGIVLIVLANDTSCKSNKQAVKEKSTSSDICSPSEEASRVNLMKFLEKVKNTYYEMIPEEIAWKPDVTSSIIRNKFKVHDPKPANIKLITNTAKKLLNESIDMNPDKSKLKPREHKAYLQVQHFLRNTFAYGYLNYTAGLWLLGPTSFCTEPICYIGYAINNAIGKMSPKTEKDVYFVEKHLDNMYNSLYDYIDVLKMGIQKGMVRTQKECAAGINALKVQHPNINKEGPAGIAKEWYTSPLYKKSFFDGVKPELDLLFVKKTGKNVPDYISGLLETKLRKPIHDVIVFLEKDHYLYCRPDNIGPGGLSALPLNFIWYKGNKTNNRTNPFLPNCTASICRLNGSESYRAILNHFTTKDIHPNEIYDLGWENLNTFYPQVLEIARKVTQISNTSEAVKAFQKVITNHSLNYFHEEPLPENETTGDAFTKCTSEETAKLHCPNRWKAMMKWFAFAEMTMSKLDPITINHFFYAGLLQSTPSCPVKLVPDFNPSESAQSYLNSDANCTQPSHYYIPFFLKNLGPKFAEYSVNAHEARPGHHTEVQGGKEHFRDACGGATGWLSDNTYYTAFTEGWALYAENPLIAQGTDIYKENLLQKYGMLKWQIWRALRLIVDTGLHYKGMTRERALQLFKQYAWDATDFSQKEVTRYQSNYGQATAYMIGQLDIWQLRNETEKALGEKYDIKEFHLQVLSQDKDEDIDTDGDESSEEEYIDNDNDSVESDSSNSPLQPDQPRPALTTISIDIVTAEVDDGLVKDQVQSGAKRKGR